MMMYWLLLSKTCNHDRITVMKEPKVDSNEFERQPWEIVGTETKSDK